MEIISTIDAERASQRATQAGKDGTKVAKANAYTGMQLEEARQIIGVNNLDDIEAVRKVHNINNISLTCWFPLRQATFLHFDL